ncbi:PPPDE peptidase, putative [Plasmodium ovale curtisi]|uniref:PPPDE peptidase, putative n=1 Tax=Plasmodium ovale curtisi TaxID=864141 RepID=A0A1A8VV33_PLAOA|nr:PPPDE peptidase, putative [Plasmodium ovale curtisi]
MKKKIRINSRECIGKEKKENAPQKENAAQQKENREHDEIPQPDFNSSMVYLNIYDLDAVSKVVNTVARSVGAGETSNTKDTTEFSCTPMCAFHAGVEVYGYEYSFGYIVDGETGVTKTSARYHPYHVYRESIPMMEKLASQKQARDITHITCTVKVYQCKTPLTKEEVDMLVEVMKLQWIGDTYDILSRNCLNYADYFCNLLDVGSIPDWVMSLQKKVTWVKSNINVAASKLKVREKENQLCETGTELYFFCEELNKASGIPTVINFLKKKYNENNEEYEGCKVVSKS